MTDELEGPDPNDVRRHAKRMYTELQYRKKYRRIDFYTPNRKQMAWHNLEVDEKMLRAGNQCGHRSDFWRRAPFHAQRVCVL